MADERPSDDPIGDNAEETSEGTETTTIESDASESEVREATKEISGDDA